MGQQLAAGLGEGQVTEFIKDDKVDAGKRLGEAGAAQYEKRLNCDQR